MEKVMQKLNTAVKSVENKVKELDIQIKENDSLGHQLKEGIADVKAKKADLKEREVKIKGIEDVVLLSKKADDTLVQAKKVEKETKITVDAFATYEAQQTEVIRRGILKNNARADELGKKAEELQKKELELTEIITEKVKKILKK